MNRNINNIELTVSATNKQIVTYFVSVFSDSVEDVASVCQGQSIYKHAYKMSCRTCNTKSYYRL